MTVGNEALHTLVFGTAPAPAGAFVSPRVEALLALLRERLARPGGALLVITGAAGAGKTYRLGIESEAPAKGRRQLLVIDAGGGRVTGWELIKISAVMLGLGAITGAPEQGLAEWQSAWERRPRELPLPAIVIDHADALDAQGLETLSALLGIGAPRGLSFVLLGRPRLEARIPRPPGVEVETLGFPSLTSAESEAYLRHRFGLAGIPRLPFTRLAIRLIGSYAGGNPGLIDRIASRALQRGETTHEATIGERTTVRAAHDVVPRHVSDWLRRYPRTATLASAAIIALACWWLVTRYEITGGQVPMVTMPAVDQAQVIDRFRTSLPPMATANVQVWSELLARWQVASKDASVTDAIRCDAQVYIGLNCLSGRGSLEQLRRFDRPIVLELDDPAKQQVLLVGAGDSDVRLFTGRNYLDIPQALLAKVWSGRFYAIYTIDPAVPLHTRLGDRGPGAAWLAARLKAGGATGGNAVFDHNQQQALRQLQRQFGISDDGIAGPETLFAVAASDADGPHLARNVR